MDEIRASLSRTKKKFKQRLTGRKRKPDGTGTNPGEERTDSTSSLPQPAPHVVADKDYTLEGDGAKAAGEQVFSTDRTSQPDGSESVSARGDDNSQEGGEADADGGEASQMHSYPHLDLEVAEGSGRSGELEGAYPSPSTPSILRGVGLDSTQTQSFRLLPIIIPSDNADTSALPDRRPEVVHPDESLEPSTTADEKKSNSKSTASPTAALLRGVRDSTGGFGLLKSVATFLCSVLDNCEVWPPSRTFDSRRLRLS